MERCWIEASVVSLLLLASRRSSTIAYIRGRTTPSALAGYAEIFWDFRPLRRELPMSQDGDADDDGATAATGEERAGRRKRTDAQSGSLTIVHPITQPAQTQPGDFVTRRWNAGRRNWTTSARGLWNTSGLCLRSFVLL